MLGRVQRLGVVALESAQPFTLISRWTVLTFYLALTLGMVAQMCARVRVRRVTLCCSCLRLRAVVVRSTSRMSTTRWTRCWRRRAGWKPSRPSTGRLPSSRMTSRIRFFSSPRWQRFSRPSAGAGRCRGMAYHVHHALFSAGPPLRHLPDAPVAAPGPNLGRHRAHGRARRDLPGRAMG